MTNIFGNRQPLSKRNDHANIFSSSADRPDLFLRHCPECMLSIYYKYLDLLSQKWMVKRKLCKAGITRSTLTGSRYNRLKTAFLYATIVLANLLRLLELSALREELWEARHARLISTETRSATRALDVAASSSYDFFRCRTLQIPTISPSIAVPPKAKAKAVKKVTFALNDTQHVEGRRRETYHRTNKSYKAGKHACPLPSKWLNTSAKLECRAFITQCKLFAVEQSADLEGKHLIPPVQQGFVWQYEHRKELMEFLGDRAYLDEKDARAECLLRLNGCDAFLAVQLRMAEILDGSGIVRRVAVFEDVHLLFLESEITTLSETPFTDAVLDQGQSSPEIEEVSPHRLSHVADSNVGKDAMDWLSITASLEEA
jgi:hypothetical protein